MVGNTALVQLRFVVFDMGDQGGKCLIQCLQRLSETHTEDMVSSQLLYHPKSSILSLTTTLVIFHVYRWLTTPHLISVSYKESLVPITGLHGNYHSMADVDDL